MSEARLVTALALLRRWDDWASGFGEGLPGEWRGLRIDTDQLLNGTADYEPLPAAAPAEGLREALEALVRAAAPVTSVLPDGSANTADIHYYEIAPSIIDKARAALARHESGSE